MNKIGADENTNWPLTFWMGRLGRRRQFGTSLHDSNTEFPTISREALLTE